MPNSHKPMTRACSVLIVDDDEEFLEVVLRRFTRRGFDAVGAAAPADAIALARQRKFDVALLDRTLPGEDGLRLMGQLKDLDPRLRMIVLSGHSEASAAEEARQRGAFDYLVKPCALADMEAAVQRAYDSTRSESAAVSTDT